MSENCEREEMSLVHSPMRTRSQEAAAISDAGMLRTRKQEARQKTLEEAVRAMMRELQELRQERDLERQELQELRRRDLERQMQFRDQEELEEH